MNRAPARFAAAAAPTSQPSSATATLRRKCACGSIGSPLTKTCEKCQSRALQNRLVVGASNDPLEQEADRIADLVTAAPPHSTIDRVPRQIQRVATHASDRTALAPASVDQALASPGRRLDSPVRQQMEQRFGCDFNAVRIHHDTPALRSARDLQARAYTVGQHIVFGHHEYSPDTRDGRRLIAHELAHVVQQSSNLQRYVQRDMFFASGYPRPYRGRNADRQETLDAERGHWHPASIDMQVAAAASGGGTGIATLTGLLGRIEASAPGSIHRLELIAHSNSEHFALAGTIDLGQNDVIFDRPDALINTDSLRAQGERIARSRDRFAKDAHIALYGCNAGAGQALLDAVSTAFGVCARGFSQEIQYCITWSLPNRRITSRGRVWLADLTDPLPQERPPCEQFLTDVHALNTDRESCVGKPKVLDFDRLIREFDDATINKFWGTDEEAVYRVLQALERKPETIDEMRRRYRQKHKGDNWTLDSVIEDEFSGTELEFALQLINRGKPTAAQAVRDVPEAPSDWDAAAKRLHDAFFADLGTDEEAVYAVLLPLKNDPERLGKLEAAYAQLDRKMSLRQRIEDEMSGSELDYALELLAKSGKT